MGYNPGQSIDRVVDHARGQGLTRFAGIVPDGVYGRRTGQAFLEAVKRRGGQMVAMQTYDRSPPRSRS